MIVNLKINTLFVDTETLRVDIFILRVEINQRF